MKLTVLKKFNIQKKYRSGVEVNHQQNILWMTLNQT